MPIEAVDPGNFIYPSLYVQDSTIQRLAKLCEVRPRGMMQIRDELSGLFAGMARQSGARGVLEWREAHRRARGYQAKSHGSQPAGWHHRRVSARQTRPCILWRRRWDVRAVLIRLARDAGIRAAQRRYRGNRSGVSGYADQAHPAAG
jgi:hypothetical protein